MTAFFITGTDTGVGKTYVACKLIADYVAQGYKVVGMKPVAAGEDLVSGACLNEKWVNDDVLKLEAASNVKAPRNLTNPYSFKPAIAPHIAAEKAGVSIEISVIKKAFMQLQQLADIVIVEGAGGFLVPLNSAPMHDKQSMADLALALNIPIILVVGMRLGCINHSLLTTEAIHARNLSLHGWVANYIDPAMPVAQENEATLTKLLPCKKLLTIAANH